MRLFKFFSLSLSVYLFLSCSKITNTPPDNKLETPTTLDNCQALLDDDRVMNGYGNGGYPSMGVICGDEYYSTDSQYNAYSSVDRQAMIWSSQILMGNTFPDWDLPYRTVSTANTVFTGLADISRSAQPEKWDAVNARGHFYRAFAFHQLQIFAPVYDSSSAATDLGIPLPQSPDLNQKISRASVQQTYDQILNDLRIAREVPPRDDDWRPTRPSLAAVYAMFARVYLSARNYIMALNYADSSLQQQSDLMSYDTIDKTRRFPFTRSNPEVIFCAAYYRSGPARPSNSFVDSLLLRSYDVNDLRRTLFFNSNGTFRGTYDEDGLCFAGIAVDEMVLTRSECLARTGHIAEAMADLNRLLATRWAAGTFTPYVATNREDALQLILQERRKELLFRGTRWADLRRLNKDRTTAHDITRTIKGTIYILPPNNPRWVLPIPDYVLKFNPGMPDNNR